MQTETGLIERVYRTDAAVIIQVAGEATAEQTKKFVASQIRWLARVAREAERSHAIVMHPLGKIKPRKIPVSMAEPSEFKSVVTPAFHSIDLPQTPTLYRALEKIFTNPSEQWFLHRISADLNHMTQIAATESCQSLIVGATVKQAIGRDRRDYMLPEDLDSLKNLMRQQMSIGSTVETNWKGYSPVTKSDWRNFFYDYSIVEDLGNSVIQLGRCRGVEPIAAPAIR